MAVASHPPHRPVLAGSTAYGSYLGCDPIRSLASGEHCCFARLRTPSSPWDTFCPALVGYVLRLTDVLLGPGPSLHHLRGQCLHQFCSAASQVLCPSSTPRRRSRPDCAFGFPARSTRSMDVDEVSRFSCA